MRTAIPLALAIAVTIPAGAAEAAPNPLPPAPRGLPWPVVAGTTKGRFAILPSGGVVQLSSRPWHRARGPRVPKGWLYADWRTGTFAHLRHGHVVVTQGARTAWSSRHSFGPDDRTELWDFQWWSRGLAFQVHQHGLLYAAWGRGRERLIGRGLSAYGITRAGVLLTLRVAGHPRLGTIASWGPDGSRIATLATGLSVQDLDGSYYDWRSGTLLYWTRRGVLVRTDGRHRTHVATARRLGFAGVPSTSVSRGGLMELLSRRWKEALLRPDGSLYARASAPTDGSVAGFGDQAMDQNGDTLAYVETFVRHPGARVYVLTAGDHQGHVVYRSHTARVLCDRVVAWHDHFLLYTPRLGDQVVIDAARRGGTWDLSQAIARLPGRTRVVRWADSQPGPLVAAAL